ncbi:MAG: metal-dependent transcriptional regulator [candidate division Zixibacteria bacterium]|nr:metal-dependent transcriptional regulator [candidate division Zixibacteria bacterium]
MITASVENYLKAVYYLQEESGDVSTSKLSELLKIRPASVTGMIKKMAGINLLVYQPYRTIKLTAKGRREALKILRRHRLIESFLVEIMGLPWNRVHQEAEKWEHVVSDDVVERMAQLLGNPKHDPHGAPIPNKHGAVTPSKNISLAEFPVAVDGIIAEVDDKNAELLRYLAQNGIRPGVRLRIISVEAAGGVMTITVAGKKRILSEKAAHKVYISPRVGKQP